MSCFKNLGLGLVVLSLCLSPLSADDSALEAELDKAIEKKEMKEYNINYNFYLVECNKIINSINNLQLSLF